MSTDEEIVAPINAQSASTTSYDGSARFSLQVSGTHLARNFSGRKLADVSVGVYFQSRAYRTSGAVPLQYWPPYVGPARSARTVYPSEIERRGCIRELYSE